MRLSCHSRSHSSVEDDKRIPMEIDTINDSSGGDWLADYGYMEDETLIDFGHPSPAFTVWSPNPFAASSDDITSASFEVNCSFLETDNHKSSSYRKSSKSESHNASGTKASREKMRRDRLNERFMELSSVLEPGRSPKTDKAVILSNAVRTVTYLRDESEKQKETIEQLEERIKELKAEKNELRYEKHKLKADKEKMEEQLRAMAIGSQPPLNLQMPPHPPPPMSAMYAAASQGQPPAKKLVPFIGYPSVSMWQYMPQSVVDTSRDHILRPPVA